jgi:two-component system response regulator MprA
MRVLVVDDEVAVRASLRSALGRERYEVDVATDGRDALDRMAASRYDAVVLDVGVPAFDGLEACRALRAAGDTTPVLLLDARDEVGHRVAGLDAGADDYLVKPFALPELQARLRAVLRRADGPSTELRFAGLRIDAAAREGWRGDRPLELSETEYALLEVFLRHPRRVLGRSVLFEQVWGYDFGATSNVLGVYLGYLRRKTEAEGEPRLLHTVRGVGYVLRDEARRAAGGGALR